MTDINTPPEYTGVRPDDPALADRVLARLIDLGQWGHTEFGRGMIRDVLAVLRDGKTGVTLTTLGERDQARKAAEGVERLAAFWARSNPAALVEAGGDPVAVTIDALNLVVKAFMAVPPLFNALKPLFDGFEGLEGSTGEVIEAFGLGDRLEAALTEEAREALGLNERG